MSLTVVMAGEAASASLSPAVLDRLQWEQFQHDEKYHREIARLSVQERLKHMALHFAKYAGKLIEAQGDEVALKRIVIDVFVIATSTANILNARLADWQGRPSIENGGNSFASIVSVLAGRMAAACEKMDHLEDYPFRRVITEAALQLAVEALAVCDAKGWSVEELVRTRLQPVKEKSIFYGRL
jgi:hypothetical protein